MDLRGLAERPTANETLWSLAGYGPLGEQVRIGFIQRWSCETCVLQDVRLN